VTLNGFAIPSFRTRSSQTTVRLRDGQSFAVAGLMSDNMRQIVRKVPLAGDLPIIGALFRSVSFQREESELLVVVTAHLVEPLESEDVPMLPGEDEDNDPNDFELFMLGTFKSDKVERKRAEAVPSAVPPAATPTPAAAPTKASISPIPTRGSAGGAAGPIGFTRN
jgi:pilus assembly protein CpaC